VLTNAGLHVQEALREAAAAEALAAIAAAGDNGHSIEVPATQVDSNTNSMLMSQDCTSAVFACLGGCMPAYIGQHCDTCACHSSMRSPNMLLEPQLASLMLLVHVSCMKHVCAGC
jgi:hypothetical protein